MLRSMHRYEEEAGDVVIQIAVSVVEPVALGGAGVSPTIFP